MITMKFGVVTFPGSNCDHDMLYVLREKLNQEAVSLWHKDTDLQGCDFIILPGGFSYGDYLRSGAIARFSPIMEEVIKFAKHGGKVLGICNGFQILCETGLLPGALLHNENRLFICENQFIKPASNKSLLTKNASLDTSYKIPIAHAEGKYFINDEGLKDLKENNQILFYYCDENSEVTSEHNPNGSVQNIAGVQNKNGNVMGMMPHPERACDDVLSNTDGAVFLEALIGDAELA